RAEFVIDARAGTEKRPSRGPVTASCRRRAHPRPDEAIRMHFRPSGNKKTRDAAATRHRGAKQMTGGGCQGDSSLNSPHTDWQIIITCVREFPSNRQVTILRGPRLGEQERAGTRNRRHCKRKSPPSMRKRTRFGAPGTEKRTKSGPVTAPSASKRLPLFIVVSPSRS